MLIDSDYLLFGAKKIVSGIFFICNDTLFVRVLPPESWYKIRYFLSQSKKEPSQLQLQKILKNLHINLLN